MSTRSRYDEFEIEVRSVQGGGYEARVIRSPFGPADCPFLPPFDESERTELLSALEWRVLRSSPAWRDLVRVRKRAPKPSSLTEHDIGGKLFAALFSGDVRDRYRQSMAPVQDRRARSRHGLRLRLSFDPGEDFAPIATLPWELLLDDEVFLARDTRIPVVRSLTVRHAPDPAPARPPLRVLLIDSAPKDLDAIQTGKERRRIKKALKARTDIQVDVFTHPDVRSLRRAVKKHAYQIVHFMGHGGRIKNGGEHFGLYFEGAQREAEAVPGEFVAEFLKDVRDLRLVVLNSCWSGAVPRQSSRDPFTGVAVSLMLRDIPATVAMQFPISDRAAIEFSGAFYASLAAGEPVEEAVTEGRLAILADHRDSLEWTTPVLFLPGDGQLFDFSRSRAARSGGAGEAVRGKRTPREELPLQLSVWSFPDPFISIEKPDDLLDLRPYFDGRKIREHRLWQEEVFPRLREFLLRHKRPGRPIVLDFAAHSTLAFAAGYCLEAKSGLDVKIYQRGRLGTCLWHAEAGPPRQGGLWRKEKGIRAAGKTHDVAMAVGVTHDVLKDVQVYLRSSRTRVGRVLPLTVSPGPGDTAVADGLHALQLAQDLAYRIRQRTPEERSATLHLFAAAPNVLLFFLGQLGRAFGSIQLYEHLFGAKELGAYLPSLQLPLPQDPPQSGS